MELLPILIILYVVFTLAKNAKKVAQKKPGARPGSATPTARPSVGGGFSDFIGMFAGEDEEPPKPKPAAKKPLGEGESVTDAAGCIGGSIEHRPMHEEMPSNIVSYTRSKDTPDSTSVVNVGYRPLVSPSKWTSAKMREAVVASEILKPPKGARRRKLAG